MFPQEFDGNSVNPEYSGKLSFIDALLRNIKENTKNDRIVIVSNYTEVNIRLLYSITNCFLFVIIIITDS